MPPPRSRKLVVLMQIRAQCCLSMRSNTAGCACSFDEILEMTRRGDNSAVDMLVGDIYGGMDYSKVRAAPAQPLSPLLMYNLDAEVSLK